MNTEDQLEQLATQWFHTGREKIEHRTQNIERRSEDGDNVEGPKS